MASLALLARRLRRHPLRALLFVDRTLSALRGAHEQEHEVGRLSANLQADAASFEGHHRRRAPRPIEFFASAAGHDTPAVADANDEGGFENAGEV